MQYAVTFASMTAVIASIIHIAFTVEHPETVRDYVGTVDGIEYALTLFFTVEIILRIFARPNPRDYLLTRYGVIDVLAVAPTWLSLFFPGLPNMAWLRALRLIRLLQIVKTLQSQAGSAIPGYGLLLQLAPFMAYAFILKTVIVVLEGLGLWMDTSGLGMVVSVIGFAIGVLLSTRLGTVQGRMYDFEVSVANFAAAVRVVRDQVPDVRLVHQATLRLEDYSQQACSREDAQEALDRFTAAGPGDVPGPVWLNVNQTAQFLLERLGVDGQSEFSRILRNVTVLYIVAVVLVVPGLTGLLSAAMVVYVLGGMLLVIRNMEKPYSCDPNELINADMQPLFRINHQAREAIEGGLAAEEKIPAAS